MSNSGPFRIEAAGWKFWLVACVVLAIPCVYGSYQVTDEHLSREIPLAIGLIGAVVFGTVVTFAANTVIQWVNAQRRATERKQSKPNRKKNR